MVLCLKKTPSKYESHGNSMWIQGEWGIVCVTESGGEEEKQIMKSTDSLLDIDIGAFP